MLSNTLCLRVRESDNTDNISVAIRVDVGQIFMEDYLIIRRKTPVSDIGPEYDVLEALQKHVIPNLMFMMEQQHATGKKLVEKQDKRGRWWVRSIPWKTCTIPWPRKKSS